jgi:hypothetical protein
MPTPAYFDAAKVYTSIMEEAQFPAHRCSG